MEKKDAFTKIIAIVGTVVMWFPILAPVLISVMYFSEEGVFIFDYLIPAELFLVVLIGGVLLTWAALRRHVQKLIVWSYGLAIGLLFGAHCWRYYRVS
jgi:hypothetical protein